MFFIKRIWVSQKGEARHDKPAKSPIMWEEYVRADLYDALRPVPVDQVPEEWRDGRLLQAWTLCTYLKTGPFWSAGRSCRWMVSEITGDYGWFAPGGYYPTHEGELTHLSLPFPLPPAEVSK